MLHICINKQTQNEMKNLENKVESKLIKNGNNIYDIKEMMKKHFKYASSTYNTVNKISECIVSLY